VVGQAVSLVAGRLNFREQTVLYAHAYAGYAQGMKSGMSWGTAKGGLSTMEYLRKKKMLQSTLLVSPETTFHPYKRRQF